jgi:hypothetical protein
MLSPPPEAIFDNLIIEQKPACQRAPKTKVEQVKFVYNSNDSATSFDLNGLFEVTDSLPICQIQQYFISIDQSCTTEFIDQSL